MISYCESELTFFKKHRTALENKIRYPFDKRNNSDWKINLLLIFLVSISFIGYRIQEHSTRGPGGGCPPPSPQLCNTAKIFLKIRYNFNLGTKN